MISNILEMLDIAKAEKNITEEIHVALGKYKHPMSIKEAYKQYKQDEWLKRKK